MGRINLSKNLKGNNMRKATHNNAIGGKGTKTFTCRNCCAPNKTSENITVSSSNMNEAKNQAQFPSKTV